jgi:hypothetical protein
VCNRACIIAHFDVDSEANEELSSIISLFLESKQRESANPDDSMKEKQDLEEFTGTSDLDLLLSKALGGTNESSAPPTQNCGNEEVCGSMDTSSAAAFPQEADYLQSLESLLSMGEDQLNDIFKELRGMH